MKRFFSGLFFTMTVAFIAACFAQAAHAAGPFAIGHVSSPDADKCVIAFPSTASAVETPVAVDAVYGLPANGNRVCKVDVSAAVVGSNTLTMALKNDLWGVLGAPVPFSFSRPAPASPTFVVDSIQLLK